jgi:hypothetical protein
MLWLLMASGAACADDPPPPPAAVLDAGPACERGTLDCGCIGGSGCQDSLLCIAGRCLQTEGPMEMSPIVRPRPPPATNPNVPLPAAPDGGGAANDASAPPGDPPDASGIDAGGSADAG